MNTPTILRAYEQTVVDGLYLLARVNTTGTFCGEEGRREEEDIVQPMYTRRKRQYKKFKAWLEGRSYMAMLSKNARVGQEMPGLMRVTYQGQEPDDAATPIWVFRRDDRATRIVAAVERWLYETQWPPHLLRGAADELAALPCRDEFHVTARLLRAIAEIEDERR